MIAHPHTLSKCCAAAAYVDEVDGGTYCTTCDAEIDPASGRRLTESERMRSLAVRELADWRERHPDWQCPECGADRGDGYCQECSDDDREDSA